MSLQGIRCCGVQEFSGTQNNTPEDVVLLYAKSRRIAHTFAILTFVEGKSDPKGFAHFVRTNKLGTVIMTKPERNINHGGWKSTTGNNVTTVIYTPDHSALTRWVIMNHDKDYVIGTPNGF